MVHTKFSKSKERLDLKVNKSADQGKTNKDTLARKIGGK